MNIRKLNEYLSGTYAMDEKVGITEYGTETIPGVPGVKLTDTQDAAARRYVEMCKDSGCPCCQDSMLDLTASAVQGWKNPKSLVEHDKQFHHGHYDGKSSCKLREKQKGGDKADSISEKTGEDLPTNLDDINHEQYKYMEGLVSKALNKGCGTYCDYKEVENGFEIQWTQPGHCAGGGYYEVAREFDPDGPWEGPDEDLVNDIIAAYGLELEFYEPEYDEVEENKIGATATATQQARYKVTDPEKFSAMFKPIKMRKVD